MKKAYVKPELFCEEYELSTAIAGNCGTGFSAFNVNSGDPYSCSYTIRNKTVFLTPGICTEVIAKDDESMYCYQTADDYTRIFSS